MRNSRLQSRLRMKRFANSATLWPRPCAWSSLSSRKTSLAPLFAVLSKLYKEALVTPLTHAKFLTETRKNTGSSPQRTRSQYHSLCTLTMWQIRPSQEFSCSNFQIARDMWRTLLQSYIMTWSSPNLSPNVSQMQARRSTQAALSLSPFSQAT